MKDDRGPVTQVLRPVIDTFSDSAVAIAGCHSAGIQREPCEYDVVLVTDEPRPKTSIKAGNLYFDLFFMTEKEALRPKNPEVGVSLASVKIVKDSDLILSTSAAAAGEALPGAANKSSQACLAASLKAMGRADEAITEGEALDANFWLLSAALDFARAWLYSRKVIPAPSHLLVQLRKYSRGSAGMYEAYSLAAGLERASRESCEGRLDTMAVLYDLLEAPTRDPEAANPAAVRVAFAIVKEKSAHMMKSYQNVDCYSFLGHQVVEVLPALMATKSRRRTASSSSELITLLSKGKNKLLGEAVVEGLGLGRDRATVRACLKQLRTQLSILARKA